MRIFPRLLLLLLALIVVGCRSSKPQASDSSKQPASDSSKPQDLIVGKWKGKTKLPGQVNEIEVTVEYLRDGTMKQTQMGIEIAGSYKFLDDNTIEEEATFMGRTQKEKTKVSVTKD